MQQKARDLGLSFGSYRPKRFTVERPEPCYRSAAEIFADQAERHRTKCSHHESKATGLKVTLEENAPYGILFFGDPHLDDDGTDLAYFAYCAELVRSTEGLYAANIGDLSNNWCPRLAGLYAHQHTTDDEGVELVKWMLTEIPWLFVILGNHDKWSHVAELLCQEKGVPYVSHGAKFRIHCGESELVVDASHDHPGRSMYNPGHGQLRKNHRGSDADIIIAGHTHQSAYTVLKNAETGKIGHCIRVGSFKRADDFRDRLGLSDNAISPAVLCVVNPGAPESSRVQVFHDPAAGVWYLTMLRKNGPGGVGAR